MLLAKELSLSTRKNSEDKYKGDLIHSIKISYLSKRPEIPERENFDFLIRFVSGLIE